MRTAKCGNPKCNFEMAVHGRPPAKCPVCGNTKSPAEHEKERQLKLSEKIYTIVLEGKKQTAAAKL